MHPRFVEIDMMQVVHHSKYWSWFEESRWNFLEQILEIKIQTFQDMDILMPIIDCNCQYKKSVTWHDPVIIDTKLELNDASNFRFVYQVLSPSTPGKIFSVANTKHVFIDRDFKLKFQVPALLEERVYEMSRKKAFAFVTKEKKGRSAVQSASTLVGVS